MYNFKHTFVTTRYKSVKSFINSRRANTILYKSIKVNYFTFKTNILSAN